MSSTNEQTGAVLQVCLRRTLGRAYGSEPTARLPTSPCCSCSGFVAAAADVDPSIRLMRLGLRTSQNYEYDMLLLLLQYRCCYLHSLARFTVNVGLTVSRNAFSPTVALRRTEQVGRKKQKCSCWAVLVVSGGSWNRAWTRLGIGYQPCSAVGRISQKLGDFKAYCFNGSMAAYGCLLHMPMTNRVQQNATTT